MNKEKTYTLSGLIKAIGPGILYTGAAVGASHLVQSTRAGASYGTELLWAVILINLFKYPFFEFAYRYSASTGKSMLEGYKELGRWAIVSYFLLSLFTGFINFAAITIVTASLTAFFFKITLSPFLISIIILVLVLLVLYIGKYAILDKMMKLMVAALTIATIIAFVFAFFHGSNAQPNHIPPQLWDAAGIAFILALMGWMPTPIEAAAWPTLWAAERSKQTNYKPKYTESLIDFHIGYIWSAVMALIFLGLGTLVMYGTGEKFSNSSVEFSGQLVSLYSKALGQWAEPVIALIALLTIFTTALTVIDGYPRALEGSVKLISNRFKDNKNNKLYWFWALLLSALALLILGAFTSSMKVMLDFATVVSFLAAPVFAFINFRVATSRFVPAEHHPKLWLKFLSWLGIVFLVGFSIAFILSLFLL